MINTHSNNPKWKNLIQREKELYPRHGDLRSEFERDYTRILHSKGYGRLKHKTQVFFATQHDHVCTNRVPGIILQLLSR